MAGYSAIGADMSNYSLSTYDLETTPANSPSSSLPSSFSPCYDSPGTRDETPPPVLESFFKYQLPFELSLRIMFSFNTGHILPTLEQRYRFWGHSDKGRLIIKYLSSFDCKTVQPDHTTLDEKSLPDSPSSLDSKTILSDPSTTVDQSRPTLRDYASQDNLHNDPDHVVDFDHESLFDIDYANEKVELAHPNDEGRCYNQGMPPDFIRSFCLEKVFVEDYEKVEFGLGLAGLDYLQDLECTRQTALRDASKRLGITEENWRDVLAVNANAKSWVVEMDRFSVGIELSYSEICYGIRLWIMLHELQSKDFDKDNALAMLNTLFPPGMQELPNARIQHESFKSLHTHRKSLYRYVQAVEANGPTVLNGYIKNLKERKGILSWPMIRQTMESYFYYSLKMIEDAQKVHSMAFFRHPERYGRISSYHEPVCCPQLSPNPQPTLKVVSLARMSPGGMINRPMRGKDITEGDDTPARSTWWTWCF